MLKSNIQETTVTTGSGSLTLAGADEGGRSFASQYAINERFDYFIDDLSGVFESGVGYLSDSTTLIRELPIDGSSALPVSFNAGSKKVFVGVGAQNSMVSSIGFGGLTGTVKFSVPFNLCRLNATQSLVSNRQYFFEAVYIRAMVVDLMGVYITTGAGTSANKLHVGLYDVDPDTGVAGSLIVQAANLDPSSSGVVSGVIDETLIQPGVYIMSIWSDVTPSIRANDTSILSASALSSSTIMRPSGHAYTSALTGLNELPEIATVTTNNQNGRLMAVTMGHT